MSTSHLTRLLGVDVELARDTRTICDLGAVVCFLFLSRALCLVNCVCWFVCSTFQPFSAALPLYCFRAPGLQLDNEVSQSTDQPRGTVCHQHYGHRTCRRAPSSGHWRRTCPAPLRRFHDSDATYKYPDSLTYLFTYFSATYKYPDLLTYLLTYFSATWAS